ncbi:recombination regulator RecX [Rhizobium sp. SSA_523]|uniref:recombination regulator RecX n=1 Tax=Rhizobium sp. SSA_523 TaxID=2952477 RepID=UPI0020917FB6|nr:recombination regulator RecX [Rhizobium sp. SSA_523]MCO5731423.1 recombination regulator RecX [Rhizobium sp. SSA_523]WKC22054.1 recombination regulator RecX [Rhizobium sp. SSA_523]
MTTDDDDAAETSTPTPRMLAWAKNSAAYRLSRRMMTQKQLADAISRKAREKFEAITDEQVRALADHAVAFGLDVKALDDAAYADIRTRSSARAGKSRKAIARTLVQKGVDRKIVTEAVQATDDLTAAVIYARRRAFGPFRRLALDDRQKAKELSAFARQGFSYEIGARIVGMDLEEAEACLSQPPDLFS